MFHRNRVVAEPARNAIDDRGLKARLLEDDCRHPGRDAEIAVNEILGFAANARKDRIRTVATGAGQRRFYRTHPNLRNIYLYLACFCRRLQRRRGSGQPSARPGFREIQRRPFENGVADAAIMIAVGNDEGLAGRQMRRLPPPDRQPRHPCCRPRPGRAQRPRQGPLR